MLISDDYRKQQEEMHRKIPRYGHVGEAHGERVGIVIDTMQLDTVLDYGCGHNLSLQKNLSPKHPFEMQCYDPGVPEYADLPEPAQLVCCIDVLEHIEPDCLDDVLDHLEALTELMLYTTIHTGPAGKTLPDGRNAHLIQEPIEWWLLKILEREFETQSVVMTHPNHYTAIFHKEGVKVET